MIAQAPERIITASPARVSLPWIRIGFWLFAILAGASQAWTARDTMATDGISYLDMGDAFAHGNAAALINGYWSPLYPAAIGAVFSIAHPAPQNEFAALHAINFAIFLVACAAFEFFLRSVLRAVSSSDQRFLQIIAYAIFLWSSLTLITVKVTSPDMLLAAFAFLASSLVIRIAMGSTAAATFAILGAALGIGYIAKAPLFPLAFVFLAAAFLIARHQKVPMARFLLAPLLFVLCASPLVLLLSANKHRLTFGDSGKLNYAWYVDGAAYRHWQGDPLGTPSEVAPHWTAGPVSSGVPAHATRRILDSPEVYEFGGSTAGTYPVWYDPSYWNDGIRGPFNVKQQIRKIITNVKFNYALLLNLHAVQLFENGHAYLLFSPFIVACLLILVALGARPSGFWTIGLPVILPALAAFGMYILVYEEPRHIAPFAAMLYIGCFASLNLRNLKIQKPMALAVVLALTLAVAQGNSHLAEGAGSEDWQVAQGLEQLGLHDGSKVAALNYANHDHVRWARLARAKIVAELFPGAFTPNEDIFWKADAATQTRVIDALEKSGAEWIVSRRLPAGMPVPDGWRRVGTTKYIVFKVPHA